MAAIDSQANHSNESADRIDAHQHFWIFDPVRDSWIDESLRVIQRDFLPSDLEPVLKQNQINGCVAVQADQSEAENEFLLEQSKAYPFIKGIVGWVDLQSAQLEERLAYYQSFGKMKGFRHVLQGEPQRDLMLDPAFMKGIGLLDKYNFTYDILIFPDQLAYALQLVKAFPNQRFVIDHIAKPAIKKGDIDQWQKELAGFSGCSNVYCKISGMVTEADWKDWKQADFSPYLDAVVNTFGIDRIMFGSDWPVCLVAANYPQMLQIVKDYFSSFSITGQQQFFGLNAARFYKL